MKTLVVIPAYNEDLATLSNLVDEIKKYVKDVLVVDDGSKEKVLLKNCEVLRNDPNKGKGFSLMRGYRYAKEKGYDCALVLDADGEHKPEDIPKFLDKIKDYDFVIGERKQYRSFKRKFLNKFATFWFELLIPGISDMYCGFRIVKTEKLDKMTIKSTGFVLEPEMLLEAVKNGLRIGFVDIKTNPLAKTTFTTKDYIKTNNFYDKWILENHKYLKINLAKRLFLLMSARLGLALFGRK